MDDAEQCLDTFSLPTLWAVVEKKQNAPIETPLSIVIFGAHRVTTTAGERPHDCSRATRRGASRPISPSRRSCREAFAYIEREYNDVKGRVEFQRHVVAQLHMVAADTGEAEAALDALLDDEASKLRILDYCETG